MKKFREYSLLPFSAKLDLESWVESLHVCMIGHGFHSPWNEGCVVAGRDLIIALKNHMKVSVISGVRTDKDINYGISRRLLDSAQIWARLKSLSSEEQVDIVHIYNASHFAISALTKALLRRKTVAHVFGASSRGDLLSANLVDAYICTSKRNYSLLVNKGIPEEKVHVVPPIVNSSIYHPLENPTEKANSSETPFKATYIGNIFPTRFPSQLVAEFEKITKASQRFELAIYAPKSIRNQEIAVGLERLLLNSKIKFHFAVSNLSETEKVRIYNASNVVLFPFEEIKNVGKEVIDPPLTVLEAMACGKIVIASRVLSIPEVITHSENGFLVEPGDYTSFRNTLAYVMANFQSLHYIGVNAQKTVHRLFSPERVGSKLISVYQSVLN
jgi:glycosyltransferase involved in cell wall biosynthesis